MLLKNDIVSAVVVVVVVAVGIDIVSTIIVVVVIVVITVAGNDIVRGVLFFDSLPLDLYWSLNIYYLSKLLITFHLNPVSPYIPFLPVTSSSPYLHLNTVSSETHSLVQPPL